MAESKTERAAQVLLGLLNRQRQLYADLQALADRQADLVTAGSADGLLQILAERQRLLEQVKRTNDALQPFRARWDAVCRLLTERQREEASEAIAEIGQRLQAIVQRDQQDSEVLRLRRVKIGQELQAARTSRDAIRAYAQGRTGSRGLNEAAG